MIRIPIADRSAVAEARRQCAAVAAAQDFDETDVGRVALVATELATNLVKHAGGGEILCGAYVDPTNSGLELVSLDRGPGMVDVTECLRDGYSSAGSSGHGLGAIRRQTQYFEINSSRQSGTAILARLTPGRERRPIEIPAWGAVAVAKPGETVCGDGWATHDDEGCLTIMVVDGLGHGPAAADAAVEAVRVFRRRSPERIEDLLTSIHNALRATRGAAVSIAQLRPDGVRFGGIGNVAGLIASHGETRRMVSMNGTAGHNARRIQAFDYPAKDPLCVLYSDGISTTWSIDAYAGYNHCHPSLLASMIYRDHARGRDDATVLVARRQRP